MENSSSSCPGVSSQCCPTTPALKSDASTGDDTNLFALGEAPGSDITGGGEVSMGSPGEYTALGVDTPPQGSLNPDDWATVPLESENLFLASDDTNDYGPVASLGGSMEGGLENTG